MNERVNPKVKEVKQYVTRVVKHAYLAAGMRGCLTDTFPQRGPPQLWRQSRCPT
jgi:hypothetical protein